MSASDGSPGRRHPARNPRPRAFVLRSITTVIASKIGVRGTGKYCRSFIGTVCFNMLYWTCLHPGSSLIRHPPPDPRADWTHSPRPTARRTQRGTSRLSGQGSIAARWVYLAASAPLYITGPLATCSSATERCAETVRPPLHGPPPGWPGYGKPETAKPGTWSVPNDRKTASSHSMISRQGFKTPVVGSRDSKASRHRGSAECVSNVRLPDHDTQGQFASPLGNPCTLLTYGCYVYIRRVRRRAK